MTDNKQTYRIVKVASELGVALTTVVEHLNNSGFAVENKPTTKITQEMYDLLARDFKSDKAAREEAKQLEINRHRDHQVEVTEIKDKKPTDKAPTGEFEEDVLIKNTTVNPVTTPSKEEEPKETAPVEVPEETKEADDRMNLKVVGKIDLNQVDSKAKKAKEKEEAEAKAKAEEEAKAKAKAEAEAKKAKEREEAEAKAKAADEEAKVKKAKAKADEEAKAKKDADEKAAKEKQSKETPKAEEPKVEKTETPAADERSEVRKPNYEKLQGLRVLGKIELPQEQKKKPVASSDGSHEGKKKRKRKTVGPTDNNNNNRTGGNNPRPNTNNSNNTNRGGNNPRGNNNNRGSSNPNEREEITEKQIQDKLKQTLARLQPGAGKSGQGRQKLRRQKRDQHAQSREKLSREQEAENKIIKVTEFISANELASMMDVGVNEVITACFSLGMMVSINQRLDAEMISIIAEEFGYEVEFVGAEVQESVEEDMDDPADLLPRAPIVTVMGHVDHGKTSLLDHVRKANVIAGEAGGITQHIGAYEVQLESGKKITFLDTPGHEAFTAMRARGAKITDVAIIVIAADDSVMPQTREAIAHAQAAEVPMVFAINKVDKDGANPDKIREQLAAMDILVEEWGGKFQCQEISAKKGLNIDALLEKVLLEAEMLDLKANPNKRASGSVVEAQLDKGRGIVTTVMVQGGTLRVGDPIIAGVHSGRVRAMFNERGKKIEEAGPAVPVTVLGFGGAPQAGDKFIVTKSEQEAKEISNKRQQLQREQGLRTQKHITLDEIGRRLAIGNFKELNIIVKGDVDGSVEALADALLKLSTEEIQINVIHKSVGQISESDVLLASASDAIIVGFQVRPSQQAKKLAETEGIEIKYYSIIYKAIEEIKDAMEGMLEPDIEEKETANVEIREVFKISKVGTIAGCYVLSGKISRNSKIRIIRDGVVIHSGSLDSLKRFKDDVKEVSAGYECGLNIKNFNDIQEGDIIEAYEEVEVKRKLK